jgi:predicted nucleic acid-binding protein
VIGPRSSSSATRAPDRRFSAITAAELFAGARTATDQRRIDGLLQQLSVCDVNLEVARLGGAYRRRYGPSHGVLLPDALIPATAQVHGARLVTRNPPPLPDDQRPSGAVSLAPERQQPSCADVSASRVAKAPAPDLAQSAAAPGGYSSGAGSRAIIPHVDDFRP